MENLITEIQHDFKNKKFKIGIQKKEGNIVSDNKEILKEKCGEIQITNHGIFEIKCLLCEKFFINVRNYAKHIFQFHYKCDTDITIDSFVELLEEPLDTDNKTEDNEVLENENVTLSEVEPMTSIKLIIDNQAEEENKNCSIEIANEDSNIEKNTVSDSYGNQKNEKNTGSDIDNIPLNKLKVIRTIKKKKLRKQIKKACSSENSEDENNEKLGKNTLINQKKCSKSIKVSKILKFQKSKCRKNLIENPVCKICGKQTAKYKMRQHLRSHDNSRYVHQCKICLKLFISEKSLNFHIKNLHMEEKPFICKINNCGKKYVNENALNAHIKRHGERPFSCDLCGKGFLYQSRLNEHVNHHFIILRKETGLETTDDTILSQNIINNMYSINKNDESNLQIKFDPTKRKKFKQKQVIKVKKKPRKVFTSSKPIEKIICDICGKETPKSNMKQHLRSHDNSRYTHKCDICEKLFISEKSLDLHMKNLHIKNKPFACTFEHCEKKFVNDNALKSHVIRHTSLREYKCETCNKAFIYQYRLEEHIKTYHVNGRMFKCEQCEKRFFDKYTLERHQIVHSSQKPYKCDECLAKFSRERSLEWHKKSHTGVKDYICKICGKQYALYNGIYSHMKIHGIKYSIAYEKGLTDGQEEINVENTEIKFK